MSSYNLFSTAHSVTQQPTVPLAMRKQITSSQTTLLPTRQQLEQFLQIQGSTKKLEQLSTWEQIQLTHAYQNWVGKRGV